MKRTTAFVATLTLGLGLGACSSDDDTGTSTDAATATEATATPTEATPTEATATEATATPTEAAPAPTEAAGAVTEAAAAASAGGGEPEYVLKEWTLEGSATLKPGLTMLSVVNSGKFPHEMLVIKDTTYEEAPKDELGTVLEDKLPSGSILGEVAKIEAGKSAKLEVDLLPGKYLFVCNIAFGPNSHAGKGQRLNVTVA
jgi:uncharacterized cupredoxin-like copper-binding protein